MLTEEQYEEFYSWVSLKDIDDVVKVIDSWSDKEAEENYKLMKSGKRWTP